jgi:hypothetical protein
MKTKNKLLQKRMKRGRRKRMIESMHRKEYFSFRRYTRTQNKVVGVEQ